MVVPDPSRAASLGFRWNIPNILTMMRMALVPVFLVMLLTHPHELAWRLATTAVFVVAILTDLVDGKLARRLNQVTNFGKLWDPIADKALTGSAFVGLSMLGELWWWVTIVILVREWGITWLRDYLRRGGIIMPAGRGGKLKTVLQSVALGVFLLGLPGLPAPVQWAGYLTMAVALVLTVATGVEYLGRANRLRAEHLAIEDPHALP